MFLKEISQQPGGEKSDVSRNFLEQWNINLKRPGYSPYNDLFVALFQGNVVRGFANIYPELKINRIVLDVFTLPSYRQKEMTGRLLNRAKKRGLELGAQVAHIYVREEDKDFQQFLLTKGFKPVRNYLELQLNLSSFHPELDESSDPKLTPFSKGEEPLLANTQNQIFSGTWGFCPNSVEEIKYYLALQGNQIEDVFLFGDEREVIGYFWPQIICKKKESISGGFARIHMIGIHKEYQGKGFGRILLFASLNYLQKKGVETVELTVDEQNTTALRLYKSAGFVLKYRSLWYESLLS